MGIPYLLGKKTSDVVLPGTKVSHDWSEHRAPRKSEIPETFSATTELHKRLAGHMSWAADMLSLSENRVRFGNLT